MTEESSKAQERGFGQNSLSDSLSTVLKTLEEREKYQHAVRILNYDEETVCPEKGLEEQGEIEAFLDNQGYRLTKIPEYLSAADSLIQGKERLSKLDQILVHYLEREKEKTRNIPPEKSLEFDQIRRGAFVSWLRAKKNSDFSIFAGDLEKVRDAGIEEIRLRGAGTTDLYDQMLDDYEEGITTEDLDAVFSDFLDRMTPLLKKIVKSRKVIRTDFLSRPVTDEQQRRLTNALLKEMGFDFTRGAWAMSEHPFTDNLGKDDSRITTHFMPNAFLSSMYSVLHEGGHALFMQNQPEEDYLR
ncbi:MAG: hypothetical protein PUC44_04300, partial [Eubacteriales bacterium]|nr:hypothetical protein [Eubacteriales bacterium]